MSSILSVRGLCKTYHKGPNRIEVLNGIDLELETGTTTALIGVSGAGKSTLMHILGALDRPTSGEVFFQGEDIFKKSDRELAAFRNKRIGFVFQFHHLLPEFTALENVMMPALIARMPRKEATENAQALLSDVGLLQRMQHRPGELSGGEQQRVAIARALITQPAILLADEPTGNLDSASAAEVLNLLARVHEEGRTIVMVTHSSEVAQRASRILRFADGLLVGDETLALR